MALMQANRRGDNTTTRLLVADYVHHTLARKGLMWPPSSFYMDGSMRPADGEVGPVERTMRALGEELEARYTQVRV